MAVEPSGARRPYGWHGIIGNSVKIRNEPVAVSGDEDRQTTTAALTASEALWEGAVGRAIRESEDLPQGYAYWW